MRKDVRIVPKTYWLANENFKYFVKPTENAFGILSFVAKIPAKITK